MDEFIAEKLRNGECGFDAYLEDESSEESIQRISTLTKGSIRLNVFAVYKGFGARTLLDTGETKW